MRTLQFILFFLLLFGNLWAQQNKDGIFITRASNDSYLYVNNSPNNWYTLEIKADTLFRGEKFFVSAGGQNIFQIFTNSYESDTPWGVIGNLKKEKELLTQQYQKELRYFEDTVFKTKLKSEGKLHYNSFGKPFCIWWLENKKIPESESSSNENSNTLIKATNSLYLNFIAQGKSMITVCKTVFENEDLEEQIKMMEEIANSVNIYGFFIEPKALRAKINKDENYTVENDLIEIKVPLWLNVLSCPIKDSFMASFPEKENIINTMAVTWVTKSDTLSFDDFKKKFPLPKAIDENSLKTLVKEEKKEHYFYTERMGGFHSEILYLEGDKAYYGILFTATGSTYKFNLKRFYEIINGIKLK